MFIYTVDDVIAGILIGAFFAFVFAAYLVTVVRRAIHAVGEVVKRSEHHD